MLRPFRLTNPLIPVRRSRQHEESVGGASGPLLPVGMCLRLRKKSFRRGNRSNYPSFTWTASDLAGPVPITTLKLDRREKDRGCGLIGKVSEVGEQDEGAAVQAVRRPAHKQQLREAHHRQCRHQPACRPGRPGRACRRYRNHPLGWAVLMRDLKSA